MTMKLVVSEPWDFRGKDGTNAIAVDFIKAIDSRKAVFKSKEVIDVNNEKGAFLILSARFGDASFENFDSPLVVNGALLSNFNINQSLDEIIKSAKFVLIGSLHRN